MIISYFFSSNQRNNCFHNISSGHLLAHSFFEGKRLLLPRVQSKNQQDLKSC